MARFKVHKYNQVLMAQIGLHSYNLTEPSNEFFKSFATLFHLSIVIVFFTISSGAIIYLNWPHLEIILEPILVVMAGVQYGGMFLSIGVNMKRVKTLHLTLQQIVNEAKRGNELNIYWECEQMCRKYTKAMAVFIPVNQTMFCGAFIFSIYNIFVGNLDTSTWILPFNLAVPFNTERILGWYILCFIQFFMGISYSLCISTTTSYFVSSCFYICAICDHFDLLIDSLKEDIQPKDGANKANKANKSTKKRYEKIVEKLRNSVEIHVKLYDVFKMVADINSGSIFSLLLPNVIFVACTMYNTENSSSEMLMMMGFHVLCVVCSLAWPYLFCYFATIATLQVEAAAQTAYNSIWLDLPPDLQKYFILIIARSQEPVHFTGFGLFHCTLEVLGQLFKTSCSYYLIFRRFSQRQHL